MSLTKLSLAGKSLSFFYSAKPPLSEPNKEERERGYELMIEKINTTEITCSEKEGEDRLMCSSACMLN
jgi:hypothetical protein